MSDHCVPLLWYAIIAVVAAPVIVPLLAARMAARAAVSRPGTPGPALVSAPVQRWGTRRRPIRLLDPDAAGGPGPGTVAQPVTPAHGSAPECDSGNPHRRVPSIIR